MAGKRVGREIVRFSRDNKIAMQSMSDFRQFVEQYKLAGEMEFHQAVKATYVRISQCKTCPKKVGHYTFDGTACPWGGILSGILSEIDGKEYSSGSKLIPGDKCVLEIKLARENRSARTY